MAPPRKNIEQYKDHIRSWYLLHSLTVEDIINKILDVFGETITRRTLERRLQLWGFSTQPKIQHHGLVRTFIAIYFSRGYKDEKISRRLAKFHGCHASVRQVSDLRAKMGLKRRQTLLEIQSQQEVVEGIIREHVDTELLNGYGRDYLRNYFRNIGVIASRDAIFNLCIRLDPVSYHRRCHDTNRRTGETIIPGPNFMWCIDGHDKLSQFGIEIYAAIDAYSRKIMWIYVGISNRTAQSVGRQYLLTIESRGIQPQVMRSDRGKETDLAYEVHLYIARLIASDPSFRPQQQWYYGTSKQNQRIESWWSQFSKSQLYFWREYFIHLRANGFYDDTRLSDCVAFLAVYMPIIRTAAHQYMDTWNMHHIRKQKNRPNSVPGQPEDLYEDPPEGVIDYGVPVDPEFARRIRESMPAWDIDEYLPKATLDWCSLALARNGIDLDSVSGYEGLPQEGDERLHVKTYKLLRSLIRAHELGGYAPVLQLSSKPEGGVEGVLAHGGDLANIVLFNAAQVQNEEIEGGIELERDPWMFDEEDIDEPGVPVF